MESREAGAMACMTHECMRCQKTWFNNRTEYRCSDCGGRIVSTFDEAWLEFDGVVPSCDEEDWYEESADE